MQSDIAVHLKKLPAIDTLLRHCAPLTERYGREIVLSELQVKLQAVRQQILEEGVTAATREHLLEQICEQTSCQLEQAFQPSLRSVFNLTGIILHTNLGRAPYPQVAIDAMISISSGACNLEYNLATGKRGRRDDHVEKWICALTGAQAATTVNNNAAAVLLTLNTLARKKEVIVSRGELIEIGGSFRMPAIMKKAGCKLREVGTTNRTHLKDYQSAVNKRTAAMMKVHTSNYEINGFSSEVTATELSSLAQKANLPLIDDMGSGNLIDLTALGLPGERTAAQALSEGVDVITFSGDKLLGGPQCGIIAGKKSIIEQIDRNPMKRALRLDKLTLTALESVLKLYTTPTRLRNEVPALRMLSRPLEELQDTASALQAFLTTHFNSELTCTVDACQSQIGSGALPTKTLPSVAVALAPKHQSPDTLAARLRQLPQPVIGRISHNKLYLDVRALEDSQGLYNTLGALGQH